LEGEKEKEFEFESADVIGQVLGGGELNKVTATLRLSLLCTYLSFKVVTSYGALQTQGDLRIMQYLMGKHIIGIGLSLMGAFSDDLAVIHKSLLFGGVFRTTLA